MDIFSVATDAVSVERVVDAARGRGGSLAHFMCPPSLVDFFLHNNILK